MLVQIGWFSSRNKARERLHRLVQRKQIRIAGTGEWKSSKQFRSSQLPTLIYYLQRVFKFGCAQRDPMNKCPS